ncbi:hypothetical protein D6D03_01081 [Aureobasidium pullulans]|nr:hypothetical protein D6D03_01081 [Aureobasidium pullulans]
MIPLRPLLSLLSVASTALAIGQNATVAFNASAGSLNLASGGSSVQIMADSKDWPAALKAAHDLSQDFGRVTGTNGSVILSNNSDTSGVPAYNAGSYFSGNPNNASMIFNITGLTTFATTAPGAKGGVIIAGTIGNSSLIDTLIQSGKIDVSAINGTWEAFTSTVVSNPMEGVDVALVIAGSDRRGTVYGLYDVSEQIGVSPWYFWADSPPHKHDSIYAMNTTKIQPSPSVKYRGFFINDEAPALTGYVNEKFGFNEYGSNYGADFYHTMFELLLRLRANYLWPAQWNSMFNVDDPRSQNMADAYGIVMGTSHTEPMMRSTKEWSEFGDGTWSWATNNASIYPFFVEGAERLRPYEGVITMGMRGSGDTALSAGIETQLLENVVSAQNDILAQVFGNASAVNPNAIAKTWCLYKEVQGYYEAGMTVPEDITLLWTDDNWGNIRRLPVGNETSRSGGAGVYYHFDYVGDPRDYKWINTVLNQKTWEQMHLAYERETRNIWVVNVGDLKPLELPISHFFDLAYDINRWDKDSTSEWLELWAAREFGPEVAAQTGALMNTYSLLAGRRKFEEVDPNTFSWINYNEANNVLAEWTAIQKTAQSILDKLPAATQPAFFEMVYHPVTAARTYYDIMISAAKNNVYAQQGRTSTNAIAQHVQNQFSYDHQLSKSYNQLLGGKWNHMMDQTHIGYQYWQQPMRQALPPLQYVQMAERALTGDLGIAVEGSNATVPGDDRFHSLSSMTLYLPTLDPYGPARWIDVFHSGTQKVTWNVQSSVPYLNFTQKTGTLSPNGTTDTRIWVSVDWSKVKPGAINSTTINVTSSTDYGTQYSVPKVVISYNNTAAPSNFTGFVESDRTISIEAEHYSSISNSGNSSVSYEVIPGLSRTLSGVTLFPVTADSLTPATAPALEYDFYTFSNLSSGVLMDQNMGTSSKYTPNTVNVTLFLGTSLNTIPDRPLRYAVQVDDQQPQARQYIFDQPQGANPTGWLTAVADVIWYNTTTWNYSGPGTHKLKIWELEPGVVLQKVVVDLGGVRKSYLGPPESHRV